MRHQVAQAVQTVVLQNLHLLDQVKRQLQRLVKVVHLNQARRILQSLVKKATLLHHLSRVSHTLAIEAAEAVKATLQIEVQEAADHTVLHQEAADHIAQEVLQEVLQEVHVDQEDKNKK